MIFCKKTILEMPKAMRKALAAGESSDTFEKVMQLQGKAFRDVPGRKTIQASIGNKSYFTKQHFGVGWGEIFKNLISFKKPILGAMTEVSAILKLDEIGISTTPLVAYGQRGCNPATMQSFVMTEDLGDIVTLEDVCRAWLEGAPNMAWRAGILKALAQLAAKLHSAGLCHRDFYLCHFVLKKTEFDNGNLNLYLIDLHRMLQDQQSNGYAVMKDIAGLYFSMQQIGLSVEDWAIFKQNYLLQSDDFWTQVEARAANLLAKFNSEKFQQRLTKEKSALD
jgi:heptose I phosphotransferase